MNPCVVIVGRPNVGKSTLFNRLVGYRKAIVYNRPGVTRDRNEEEINVLGRKVSLIDTGGFEFGSKDIIDQETMAQIEKGIEDASLLLWVVDGKKGIHTEDERLSKVLRKLNKPIVMVYNKIDPGTTKNMIFEFQKLGFKESVEVSAEHGLGVEALQEKILQYLPEEVQKPVEVKEEGVINIAIVGRPNVGKSSIINAIMDQERLAVSEIAGTTRDMIDITFTRQGQKYVFLDTAGMRVKRKVQDDVEYFSVKRAMEAISRADVVMLILSGPDNLTTQEEKIAAQIIKNNKPLCIFANKWDLSTKGVEPRKEFREDVYDKAPFLKFADIFFISAKEKKGLDKIFVQANHLYKRMYHVIEEEELIQAYKVISSHHHQVGSKGHFLELKRLIFDIRDKQSPVFKIKCNRPKLATPSYERYWRNALVDFFKLRGIPIGVKFRQK